MVSEVNHDGFKILLQLITLPLLLGALPISGYVEIYCQHVINLGYKRMADAIDITKLSGGIAGQSLS